MWHAQLITLVTLCLSAVLSTAHATAPENIKCEVKGTTMALGKELDAIIKTETWTEERRKEEEQKPFGGFLPCTAEELRSSFPNLNSNQNTETFSIRWCRLGGVKPLPGQKTGDNFTGYLVKKANEQDDCIETELQAY